MPAASAVMLASSSGDRRDPNLYVDTDRGKEHRARLASQGLDVERATKSGNLQILTSEDTYTRGGRFGAVRMYQMLHGALADARAKGRRVRTSGVMEWATRGHAGTEELMEYESRVNFLVPTYECTRESVLCVADRAAA